MSLIITITNDQTGNEVEGNYHYEVRVGRRVISTGKVSRFPRYTGWQTLVQHVVECELVATQTPRMKI